MLAFAACTPEPPDTGFTASTFNPTGADSSTDEGDGDGDTGDGDGDGDSGDGDGDSGDGDGDSGDGDGDSGDGDGDGPPPDPTCDDGIQNQDETDVDCGGSICGDCTAGEACLGNSDCDTNVCQDGICTVGCQGDVECDVLDGPCLQGICNLGICEQFPANPGGDCTNDEVCKTNGQCMDGVCVEEDLDCTDFDSDCTLGYCDLDTGECAGEIVNEGMPCDDANGCFDMATCTMGVCEDPDGGALFYEDFADNSAGWTLGPNWQIGPAAAGCGDPGTDHSPTDDNGIAGVVLGGCAPTPQHAYYCLTSPVIDTAGMDSVWMTYYRDLWSDYTPYMKNIIEVYDGNTWQLLFETLGSPGVDDMAWTYFAYDVSVHANANMQFRWCYNIQSGGVFNRGSWNVDDVTVAGGECNGGDP